MRRSHPIRRPQFVSNGHEAQRVHGYGWLRCVRNNETDDHFYQQRRLLRPVWLCRRHRMVQRADDLFTRLLDMADSTAGFGIMAGAAGKLRDFKAGDVIFKQGDTGQELFIIKSGKVEIRIGNHVLDTLSPGIPIPSKSNML
jgi:hypothetical protein